MLSESLPVNVCCAAAGKGAATAIRRHNNLEFGIRNLEFVSRMILVAAFGFRREFQIPNSEFLILVGP